MKRFPIAAPPSRALLVLHAVLVLLPACGDVALQDPVRTKIVDECRLIVPVPECARRDPSVARTVEDRHLARIVDTDEKRRCVLEAECAPSPDGADEIVSCLRDPERTPPDQDCAIACSDALAACADAADASACTVEEADLCVVDWEECLLACPRDDQAAAP